MIYLASPYWHQDPLIRSIRARENAEVAARLAVNKVMVFAPVVHGHFVSELDPFHDIPEDYWLAHGLRLLPHCSEVWVLNLLGWDESRGVAVEVRTAGFHNIPVALLNYENLETFSLPDTYDPLKFEAPCIHI